MSIKKRNLSGIYIFEKFEDEESREPTCIEDCTEKTQDRYLNSIVILPDYNVLQEVYNIAIKKEPKYFSTYIRKYLIGDLLNPNTNIKDYLGIKQFYKNKNS